MNNSILEKLTFGFEIEGFFKEGLDVLLDRQGRWVSDGSVRGMNPSWQAQTIPLDVVCNNCRRENGRIEAYCVDHHAMYHREGAVSTEYASRVFDNLDDCGKALAKFIPENHIWNESCGLHLHIGYKGRWQKLWSSASNQAYLEELEEEAKTWCACQKARLNGGRQYFYKYHNSLEVVNATKGFKLQKYRFLNFHHHYHTLEFRFLSPCEHKVQNVSRLLNSLTGYLGRNEKIHRESEVEETPQKKKMDIVLPIYKQEPIHLRLHLEPGEAAARQRGEWGRSNHGYAYVIEQDPTPPERVLMGQGMSREQAHHAILQQQMYAQTGASMGSRWTATTRN